MQFPTFSFSRSLVALSLVATATLITSLPLQSRAATDVMSEDEIVRTIKGQGISDEQALSIVKAMKESSPDKKLNVTGFLYTSGFNGAFFRDTDTWDFEATVADESGTTVALPGVVTAELENGGIAFDLGYKWVLVFTMGNNLTYQTLNGASCGRGIGVTAEAVVGIDLAWMPCSNRTGSMFIVAPKIGFGGGLRFPKITFSTKSIK